MDYTTFLESLKNSSPDSSIKLELKALWYEKNGNWDKAHELVQHEPSKNAARIHAYLHRKEGDQWNANYWYKRANDTMPNISLNEEWEFLLKKFTD